MDNISKFLEYINEKTHMKYDFLRIKSLVYDRDSNVLTLSFIYPEKVNLSDSDKQEITRVAKEYIPIDGDIQVEISRSYIDCDLIGDYVFRFLKDNFPMFFNSLSKKNLSIVCGENIQVKFSLDKFLMEYFDRFNIAQLLTKYLAQNFYADFNISVIPSEDKPVDKNILDIRQEEMRKESDMKAVLSFAEDRYMVHKGEIILGDEISISPRHIKSINKVYDKCAVAGKVKFLSEKSFKVGKNKKALDKGEVKEKPYFSFQIEENNMFMPVVVFPSKKNYKKMQLLKEGDIVIVEGKVQNFNANFEIVARNISRCEIPSKGMLLEGLDLTSMYRYVRPQKYTAKRQTNFFDRENEKDGKAKHGTFVVFDFETTGINIKHDEIIEIGALKIKDGEFTEIFSTLVKPKESIPEGATKINRITNEMVSNCFSIGEVIQDFHLFCEGAVMVGYNSLTFDCLFLDKASKEANVSFPNKQLDVFIMAKEKLPRLKNYKLKTVANHLKVSLIDAHRALNDVMTTAEIFMKLY